MVKKKCEIIDYLESKGLVFHGSRNRDIHFGNNWVTDQVSTFKIYSVGTDTEKISIEKILRKYEPIENEIEPEPKATRKSCGIWSHSAKDYGIMYKVLYELLELTNKYCAV